MKSLLFDDEIDFWNSLDEETKKSVQRGIKDYQDGKVRPHNEVMEDLYQKYRK